MNLQADRLQRIKPSMTVAINVKANALRAQGKDVLVPFAFPRLPLSGRLFHHGR